MTLEDRPCERHEMRWCAICSGADKPTKPRATGPTIAARYPGTCACGCGRSWQAEASITYSDEAGGWVLAEHAERGA